MNQDSIIRYLIEKQINEQQNKNFGSNDSLSKINQLANNANLLGNGMSSVGNYIKDNVDNELAQKFGSNIANFGGNLSNGANTVSNTLNAPSNYFKGVANRAVGNGLSQIGSSLANNPGVIGTIGKSLSNVGTTLAGTGAGATGAGAGAGTAAGMSASEAAVGAGASAAGTAAGVGTASGGAAGGAAAGGAAGGSAAGGAAAAGPIGALVALGTMALQGANRKRAKQGGEQLLNATNQMAQSRQKNNLESVQQNTEALQQEAQNNLINGSMTGAAAPVRYTNGVEEDFPMTKDDFAKTLYNNGWDENTVNAALEGRNLGNKEMDEYIKYYNSVAPIDQQLVRPQIAENSTQTGNVTVNNDDVKTGLLNKFVSGLTDLTRGYDENKNTAFNPDNLIQDKFINTSLAKSQELTDYQNQLRNNGFKENVIDAVAQGKNSGNKDIATWINNNQDALKPVEKTTYTDKSNMARVGEALGSVARTLNRPGVQGLVAGGLSAALTGDPLYGLGQAYKFANQRAMSDIYQNALKEQGVKVNPGIFGALSNKDMTALMTPLYKQWENERMKAYYQAMADYRAGMLKNAEKKTEIDERYKNVKATNDTIKANASMIKAQKTGKKTGTSKTPKPQEHPDWGSDLAGYTERLTNPRYATQLGNMKAAFIKKYGVDPDKYIKM